MPAHLIAVEGPNKGLTLNLEEGEEWIIGRDPDTCDLILDDSIVSRKHAKLTKSLEGVYLKNLSKTNPALINGEEIEGPTLLRDGDQIQIGNTVFRYSGNALPKANTPKEQKSDAGYDDIFGDIESPEETLDADVTSPDDQEITKPMIEAEELRIPPAPPKPEMTAYDTIFEDTGTEEDLPFHLVAETPLMLKVIAGPNAGAEIGLEKGRSYTIGKDPHTCDIVFQDLSVSREHAKLAVSPEGTIEIHDLGSRNGTAINGSLISENRIITPQDLVALGTTVFMIIDREAPQETIYSPVITTPETVTAEEEAKEEEAKEKEEQRDWKKQPIPMKYLVMSGSAAAIFLIMFITFFSLFKSDGLEIANKEPLSEISEALAKYTDVQYSYNPGSGKLFLVGHVLTNVDYLEMKYRLDQIGFITSIEDNVVIDEGVWKMMNDVISDNPAWRGVSIHSPQAGKFVVSGYLPTIEDGTNLYEYLTVNFPYLDRLENNVVIEQTLKAQLQAIITAANLGGVTFQLANGNVILSGNYNEKLNSEVKSIVKQINGIKGVATVKNYTMGTHATQAGIDLTQQFEVTGSATYDGRGYSVVMNGKIYTIGDLVSGMKITAIDTNTVQLEKDGLKYKIDYTE